MWQRNHSGINAGASRGLAANPGMSRCLILAFGLTLISLPTPDSTAFTQQSAQDRLERFRKMSVDAETKGLAEPFKGVAFGKIVHEIRHAFA